ncbi:hypothetical protein JCM21900_000778 [Sporobolomyces salmonicolor]
MAARPTTLNFAPYSDPPDVHPQARWTPPTQPIASSPASYQHGAAVASLGTGTSYSSQGAGQFGGGYVSGFSGTETTMWRHDWEAIGCYALGPFGAALLLVIEVENDYVRFHAYQSVLLSICLFLLHLFFYLLLGSWMQYLLLILDIGGMAVMSLRAYRDSDHLDRLHLPLLGDFADAWVQAE